MPTPMRNSKQVSKESTDERESFQSELMELLKEFLNNYGHLTLSITKSGGSAALGTILAGPIGAIIAPIAVTFLTDHCGKSLLDFFKRSSSEREKARAAGALTATIKDLKHRFEQGQEPRSDGFFSGNEHRWSDAESLLDGVLRSAEAAYEEKKLLYLGYLYSSFIFHTNISAEIAHHMMYVVRAITYSQYVILSVHGSGLLTKSKLEQSSKDPAMLGMIAQIIDLEQKQLLEHDHGADLWGGKSTAQSGNALSGLGGVLYESMRLNEIRERDPDLYNSVLSRLQKAAS